MIFAPFNEYDTQTFCQTIGYTPNKVSGIKGISGGMVQVAMGLDNWTENSVRTHLWCSHPKYMTKGFIRECFKYLFDTCDLGLVIGITPCNNERALKFNQKLGWKEIARIPDGHALGTDTAIQVIRREDCRWIPEEVRCRSPRQQHQTTQAQPMLKGNKPKTSTRNKRLPTDLMSQPPGVH